MVFHSCVSLPEGLTARNMGKMMKKGKVVNRLNHKKGTVGKIVTTMYVSVKVVNLEVDRSFFWVVFYNICQLTCKIMHGGVAPQ